MRKNVAAPEQEPKTYNARLSVIQKPRDAMVHDDLSCSEDGVDDIVFDEDQDRLRASSPLDTIADVACRLGADISVNVKRKGNENVLLENAYKQFSPRVCQDRGGSQSPASIPTGETGDVLMAEVGENKGEITGDTNVSLRSLLQLLQHYKSDGRSGVRGTGQWNGGADEISDRAMIAKLCQDFHDFKNAVECKAEEQVRETRQMKEEILLLRRSVAMLQGNEGGWQKGLSTRDVNREEYGVNENVVSLRAEDGGKVSFVVRTIHDCEDDEGSKDQDEVILDGKELRIGVGSSELGKRAVRSEDLVSIGSEEDGGGDKRVRRLEMRNDGRVRMTRGESMTGTDSNCNSDGGDWNEGEKTNKRSRGKGGKGKGKRRRDNWTEDENNEFMSMVFNNQDLEEMSLRRMLARRFSPRRTHEQCANHLRILRAQKKLPAAKEEGEEKKS